MTTKAKTPKAPAPQQATAPTPTKLDQLIVLLQAPAGATIADMTAATGWKKHSVRGALAGALKKRGHSIASQKQDGIRTYRIVSPS
jgi:hypothetical protein